jgi:hypothetical protein
MLYKYFSGEAGLGKVMGHQNILHLDKQKKKKKK